MLYPALLKKEKNPQNLDKQGFWRLLISLFAEQYRLMLH